MPSLRRTLPTPASGRLAGRLAGALLGLVVAPAALTGCAALSGDAGAADGVRVATAFYPLQFVAERVAGDDATVENLTSPGVEPHDLELTVGQTATLAEADLVVHEAGFQPAVDAAVEQTASGEVLDAAEVVDPLPADPHFWLDPLRMARLAEAVADRLAGLDPEHADGYARRAADLVEELEQLDAAYRSGLADCERHTVVVSHDAFGYLATYGLDLEPIAGLSPEAEPSPQDLARLQELVRDQGLTTVFSERLAPAELAEGLAGDLDVDTDVLDPIEGLTDETADEDYLSLMEQNLAALQRANGCS